MKKYIRADYNNVEDVSVANERDRKTASYKSNNPEVLLLLAYDPSSDVRERTACNPNTPIDVVRSMLENDIPEVVIHAALYSEHPELSESDRYNALCRIYAQGVPPDEYDEDDDGDHDHRDSTSYRVAGAIANSPLLSASMARTLFNANPDDFADVVCDLAANPVTPADVLKDIYYVVKNETRFVWDEYELYRYLVENPNTPTDVLQQLAKCDDDITAEEAEDRLGNS